LVTKWLKAGKISPAALVGEGCTARIWAERASADLAGAEIQAAAAALVDASLRHRRAPADGGRGPRGCGGGT